jgi:peptidyl-dipeptidase Dcp
MKNSKYFFVFLLLTFIGSNNFMYSQSNPFFEEWKTTFQTPPFSKIKNEHYLPAFEEGIKQQRQELEKILNNSEEPSFDNTIGALERSGKLLSKVSRVFFNISSANTNEEIQKVAEKITPELSKLNNDIYLNEKLYDKIKIVYEKKDNLNLNAEENKLLEEYYKDFTRAGIGLSEEKKARLREINQQLSSLQLKFGENLRKETNAIALIIDKEEDLAGLPESVVKAASELAEASGMKGKWAFNLQRPSWTPFLQYSQKRDLREIVYKAYINRGNNNNEFDNKEIIKQIIDLRIEKAKLLGYETYAHYKLERNMAKTPENVIKFLNQLWIPAINQAKEEVMEMQKIIDKEGGNFKLAGWDWWYYSEKVKKEKYDLDEEMLRPYFKMENVRKGAFDVAEKLFGIKFIKRNDIEVYDNDVEVYEVVESNGDFVGVLYTDYYPRNGKRAGAWMSYFRGQSNMDGEMIYPLVTNVGNFSKPTSDKPALLSFDDVNTLFHEFGHALNGLFARSTYPGSKRSSVDFVELPSQIMENLASHPEVLKMYALHYETNEPMPDYLIEKIKNSKFFNNGFQQTEYLAASFLDMDWHLLTQNPTIGVNEFEQNSLSRIGLIDEIASRYQSTNFNHIFGGDGYSAGYYGYSWAAVLDADAFEAFIETDLFNKEVANSFRKYILEKMGSEDSMELYKKFRGREPKVDALLKRLGFNK